MQLWCRWRSPNLRKSLILRLERGLQAESTHCRLSLLDSTDERWRGAKGRKEFKKIKNTNCKLIRLFTVVSWLILIDWNHFSEMPFTGRSIDILNVIEIFVFWRKVDTSSGFFRNLEQNWFHTTSKYSSQVSQIRLQNYSEWMSRLRDWIEEQTL